MISDTRMRYGSRVRRHGRSRPCRRYHASRRRWNRVAIRRSGRRTPRSLARATDASLRCEKLSPPHVRTTTFHAKSWLNQTRPAMESHDHPLSPDAVEALARDNARLRAEMRAVERRLELEHGVARILAEALTVEDAVARLVEALGEALGWRAGGFWRVDRAAGVLRCIHVWSSRAAPAPRFETATRALELLPDEGLPGRVWLSGDPV